MLRPKIGVLLWTRFKLSYVPELEATQTHHQKHSHQSSLQFHPPKPKITSSSTLADQGHLEEREKSMLSPYREMERTESDQELEMCPRM